MKAKVYFFRLIVAVIAFSIGIITFNFAFFIESGWQKVQAEEFYDGNLTQPVSESEMNTEPTTDEINKYISKFVWGGDFYVFDDLPKEFKNVEMVEIELADWSNDLPQPILPQGFLRAESKYRFTKILVNNELISFETEIKNKISYKFVGKFLESSQIYSDLTPDLKGVLTKFKNGKKIAETNVEFGLSEC